MILPIAFFYIFCIGTPSPERGAFAVYLRRVIFMLDVPPRVRVHLHAFFCYCMAASGASLRIP